MSRRLGPLSLSLSLVLNLSSRAIADPAVSSAPTASSASTPTAPAAPSAPDPPTVPSPTVPSPTVPSPTVPSPTVPSPTVPSPTVPAPVPPRTEFTQAFIHLASDRAGTALELRSYVDAGGWQRACDAPCDRSIAALGAEARVTAPGMAPSNVFRIEPGPGVALIKVSGGSSLARTLGIIGLGAGIPLGLGGTAMYSYGMHTGEDGLAFAGGVVLGTGAALILAAIPLLLTGTTNVRDGRGKLIALDGAAALPGAL